jgi:sugar lactone lactonase YvrE
MPKKGLFVFMIVLMLSISILSVGAQGDGPPPLASDLLSPRGIAYDAEGNLYVAESGNGGETEVEVGTPEGAFTVNIGSSSQVSMIAPDGTQSVVLDNVVGVMMAPEGIPETLGAQSVAVDGNSLWVVLSGLGPMTALPENPINNPLAGSVLEINLETGQVETIIDLTGYELANDPDGLGIDSNPNDVAVSPDGLLHIMDTGANTLFTWTPDGGLEPKQIWDNIVPTGIAFGDDGSYYVSFLGTGIAPGAGKVVHYSADGEEVASWEGMTAVTDVAVGPDGSVYAAELFLFGDEGPGPGQVSMLTDEGPVVISSPLPAPYGIAVGPSGEIAVSIGAVQAGPPMPGQVIILPSME